MLLVFGFGIASLTLPPLVMPIAAAKHNAGITIFFTLRMRLVLFSELDF